MKRLRQEVPTMAPPAPTLLGLDDLPPDATLAMTDLRMGIEMQEVTEPVHSMPLLALIEQEYRGVDDIPDPQMRWEAQERRRVALLCAEAATLLLASEATADVASAETSYLV